MAAHLEKREMSLPLSSLIPFWQFEVGEPVVLREADRGRQGAVPSSGSTASSATGTSCHLVGG